MILAFTIGSAGHNSASVLNNLRAADPGNIGYGKAYGSLLGAGRSASRRSIVVSVISGILLGLRGLCNSLHDPRPHLGLPQRGRLPHPWRPALRFVWTIYFMKHPLVGKPVDFSGSFHGPASGDFFRAWAASSGGGPCSTLPPPT